MISIYFISHFLISNLLIYKYIFASITLKKIHATFMHKFSFKVFLK